VGRLGTNGVAARALRIAIAVACLAAVSTEPASAQLQRARVTPKVGGPKTKFRVTFRTPVAAGVGANNTRRYYQIQAFPNECVQVHGFNIVGKSRPNERVRRTLQRHDGPRWCPGIWVGGIYLTARCIDPNVGCDDEHTLVARFIFRVRG
jgi:hypothetical protein